MTQPPVGVECIGDASVRAEDELADPLFLPLRDLLGGRRIV